MNRQGTTVGRFGCSSFTRTFPLKRTLVNQLDYPSLEANIPRPHFEQFELEDVETWALQFGTSYGRATEVGPSVKTRTIRLTDNGTTEILNDRQST